MNLLLSKELQVICRLIFVQNLICVVHGDQFAAGAERLQALSGISANSVTSSEPPFAGDRPGSKSELKPSNEWIKRLVRSDFENRNSIRSKRESADKAGATNAGGMNLANNVLNANVTNLIGLKLSAKLDALSGLGKSLIDFNLLNGSNALARLNALYEPLEQSKRVNELANDHANRSTKLATVDRANQSRRSRGVSGSVQEAASDLLLENGLVEVDDEEDEEDELYEIPNYLIVILAICYMTISLCAIVGNLMVLYIVIKSKKMQNPTNYLLANLSASDFLIGNCYFFLPKKDEFMIEFLTRNSGPESSKLIQFRCTGALAIPFQFEAALLQRWILPLFFCSFCPTIQQISLNCSILTLTTLSLDRFRAILYPLKTKTSRLKSKLIILIIWFLSIVFALPTYFGYGIQYIRNKATGLKDEPFCNIIGLNRDLWRIYTFSLFVLQYFLPLLITSYCYLRIGLNLLSESNSGIANSSSNRSDLGRMMKNKKRVSPLFRSFERILRSEDNFELTISKLIRWPICRQSRLTDSENYGRLLSENSKRSLLNCARLVLFEKDVT